jgi:hypothetical protein
MKKWILLLLVAIVLLFLFVRERFTTYEEALADVGQTAGYITPSCEAGYTLSSDNSTCSKDGETKSPTCPEGSVFTIRGTAGTCEPTSQPTAAESTTSLPASTSDTPSCPQGYRLAVNDKCVRESEPVDGNCSVGVLSGNTCYETADPICPSGKTVEAGRCVGPSTTGSTTGGSSTSSRGSTATSGSGKGVWGPIFPGFGEDGGPSGGDSTKTNQYPTLLGGFMGSKPSSMVPGVGVVPPSTPGLSLPSGASLGTDANSGYLPYSRQPGDMDLIPDPYRVSSTFSTSSYSSTQREPAPFLTDFSAFMR